MDRRALLRVLDRLDREPALIRWYGRTFVPSEGLFATLLRHDPAIRVHDGDLHWELWPPGSSSPRVLGVEDLPDVVSSSAFFARKFRECEALDRLDALLDPDATSDTERRLEPPVMPGPSAARVPFGSAPAGPRGVAP
jgi:hypothetical protein